MNLTTSNRNAEVTAPTAELRSAFAEMRRELEIMRRREEIREAEIARLTAEMDEAGRLQRQLVTGSQPEIDGGELYAFAHPADRVSGDFHYARRISANRVALVVGDATGHGLAAGLLSATVMGFMHTQFEPQAQARGGPDACAPDPAEVLARLNRRLLRYSLDDCEFLTAIFAVYDEVARTLRWSRAGAPQPILLRPGQRAHRLESPGMPLGIAADAAYEDAEIQLERGDSVILHTDGLEALHSQRRGSRDEQSFLRWITEINEDDLRTSLHDAAEPGERRVSSHGDCDDVTLVRLQITG